jgi:hypothetical protein
LHKIISGYRSDFGFKKNSRINFPEQTFDDRRETEVMLEFSQEDFLRQSHVNLSDYSFGYPSDD